MNVSELQAVREKIAQGWTRGAFALTEDGHAAFPSTGKAACWCLGGAAYEAGGYQISASSSAVEGPLAEALGFDSYIAMRNWNDAEYRTQAEVLSRIDDAIARASLAEEPKP